jgi:hypothetical protein
MNILKHPPPSVASLSSQCTFTKNKLHTGTLRNGQWPPKAKAEPIERTPLQWVVYKLFGNIGASGEMTFNTAMCRTAKIIGGGVVFLVHLPEMLMAYNLHRINQSLDSSSSAQKGTSK